MENDFSPDQQAVYDDCLSFLSDQRKTKQYFTFHGLAGTGKTHVLSKLAQRFPDATVGAFTGKAASVLRRRTGLDVKTCHSIVYDYKGNLEDERGEQRPVFESKGADYSGRKIFLDECSNTGSRLAEELLATGARIIACGDPGQLPPVRDSPFFDHADAMLTEPHRQALASPIIRQTYRVRKDCTYGADGDDFRVIPKAKITQDDLRFGGIALCWRNLTRTRLNVSRRKALGRGGNVLEVGEPIMVLRNDHRLQIFNGEVYAVATRRKPGEDLQIVDDTGRTILLNTVTCEGVDPEFGERRNEDDWCPVALAYATTVHKSQGSEWDDVLLIDEYDRSDQRREWLYTGLTRAAKRVLVVQA
jgi:exodeoxyribonuclease V